MALIQWTDALSVGINEIDGQHKKLVGWINELNEAMREGKGKAVLSHTLMGLGSYTKEHFATEEKYFAKFGYPETDDHIRQHIRFVQKVSDMKKGFDEGRMGLSIEVMNFLSEWLKHHIQGSDMKYAPFFIANGVK
jgi:hemerythrin